MRFDEVPSPSHQMAEGIPLSSTLADIDGQLKDHFRALSYVFIFLLFPAFTCFCVLGFFPVLSFVQTLFDGIERFCSLSFVSVH